MTENSHLRVGIIFGGSSVEHEVSVITGIQAISALSDTDLEVFPIYVDKKGIWHSGEGLSDIKRYRDLPRLLRASTPVLPARGPRNTLVLRRVGRKLLQTRDVLTIDVVIIAMHGSEGENGSLQGLFETLDIPYSGSDVTASAVGMDKYLSKTLCGAADIPVVECVLIREHEWRNQEDTRLEQCEQALGFPMIVKPSRLGSSIGIEKVKTREALEEAIEEGLRLDDKILVEACVTELREFNCSVLGDILSAEVSVIEEPVRTQGVDLLSFEQKYQRGSKQEGPKHGDNYSGMASLDRMIPAQVGESVSADIRRLAYKIFRTLGCEGVARIDFLFDETTGQLYFNEINTIPGSFSFYLWEPSGVPFDVLLQRMVSFGLDRHRRKQGKIRSYDTDLLSQSASRGLKGKSG